jgi:hypothetical protein
MDEPSICFVGLYLVYKKLTFAFHFWTYEILETLFFYKCNEFEYKLLHFPQTFWNMDKHTIETGSFSNAYKYVFCFALIMPKLWFNDYVCKCERYSQTWANDHLRINDLLTATTCLQRPLFEGTKGSCCAQVWMYFNYI